VRENIQALRTVAGIAFRYIDELNVAEREHVLIALVEVLPEQEATSAEAALFALRVARRCQLELAGILKPVA